MVLKTATRKYFTLCLLLIICNACAKQKDYIVLDNGNDNYQLIMDNQRSYEDAEFETDSFAVTFIDKDIKVQKKDCYSYQDIDLHEFWDYIVEKKQLPVQEEPLVMIGYKYNSYHENVVSNGLAGLQVIYVLDCDVSVWDVYSYVGILKHKSQYYSFTNEQPFKQDGYIDYKISQDFDNCQANFCSVKYAKHEWPIEKWLAWGELNGFEFQIKETSLIENLK